MTRKYFGRRSVALVAGALIALATACSPGQSTVEDHSAHDTDALAAVPEHDHATDGAQGRSPVDGHDHVATAVSGLPGSEYPPVVVNVSFDSYGPSPSIVNVPAGRQVQLVFRNRDQVEHHYHILGLETVGMRWLSKDGTAMSPEEAAEMHEAHHPEVQMVDYHICTSRSGICPTGQWIHAHAEPGGMDMIVFVTETPGRYTVRDPLNPEFTAEVIVF